jgi:hypothetical protein
MKFAWILTVIIILAGFCFVAYGQEELNGSVIGIVTDSQSEMPIFGAKVEVAKDGLSIGTYAITDENGNFTIKDIPAGDFALSVSKGKYLPKVVSNIVIKEGKVTEDVNISLQLITPIQVGDEARDFSLTSNNNKMLTLSDFKDKSIVVICVGNPYT